MSSQHFYMLNQSLWSPRPQFKWILICKADICRWIVCEVISFFRNGPAPPRRQLRGHSLPCQASEHREGLQKSLTVLVPWLWTSSFFELWVKNSPVYKSYTSVVFFSWLPKLRHNLSYSLCRDFLEGWDHSLVSLSHNISINKVFFLLKAWRIKIFFLL